MSIGRTRANYIRSKMMGDALLNIGNHGANISNEARFSAIYNFIDFVSHANGTLINNPKTGQDPKEYVDRFPVAGESFRWAVNLWTIHREKVKQAYLEK